MATLMELAWKSCKLAREWKMEKEHTGHRKGLGCPCTYEGRGPRRLSWIGVWGADGIFQGKLGAAGLKGEARLSEAAMDGVWAVLGPEQPWSLASHDQLPA